MDGQLASGGFSFKEVVAVKQRGDSFTKQQIEWLIAGIMQEEVSPCQVGALLMAIFMKGMTGEETSNLTQAMMQSGETLSWPQEWHTPVVDKHSTGGVGDKVSLPLIGALIASGLKVPMISGRSLGHTGGTLDKLESIPGFNVNLSSSEMAVVLGEVGGCIVGQTSKLVPADKVLYATRDVTGTVASLPLIVSSIISKKASEGIGSLVLDVKTGRGAFVKTLKESEELAVAMTTACHHLGIKAVALITDMNSPLGRSIGNALEIVESVQCLQGAGPSDLEELVCHQGGHLLLMNDLATSMEDAVDTIKQSLHNGTALDAFKRMCIAQGVSESAASLLCSDPESVLRLATHTTPIRSPSSGCVSAIDPMACAKACSALGAGRAHASDSIDHSVGMRLHVHVGSHVQQGDVWAVVYHNDDSLPATLIGLLDAALQVDASPSLDHALCPPSRLVKLISQPHSGSLSIP